MICIKANEHIQARKLSLVIVDKLSYRIENKLFD